MDPLNQIIFDDKTFSDILKEIHTNQKKKSKQIGQLIAELRPLIQNLGDATVVVPLIKEYMEVSVKNDDHLLKMAAIVQRLSTGNSTNGNSDMLTEDELNQLQGIVEEISLKEIEKKDVKTP
jgi:hypothetical protein